MFGERLKTPIEHRDYGAFYLLFAGLLFAGTLWAVVDEVVTRRPWKEGQREYFRVAAQQYQARLQQAIADFDSASYLDQAAQLRAARRCTSPSSCPTGES